MQATPAKSSVPAIVGASIAAIGASVCCVVPLVLVFMGISGAWISTLTALDPVRPWFSAAAEVSLAVAFWMLYLPASHCGVVGSCVEPDTLRRRRRWLWVATVIIVRSAASTSELPSHISTTYHVFCINNQHTP